MMALAALIAGLIAFIAILRGLKAQRHAFHAVTLTQDAIGSIIDPDLSDEVKEEHVQRASLSLLKSVAILVSIGVAACVCAATLVVGGHLAGLFDLDQAVGIATSWPFIVWSSTGAVALWFFLGRLDRRF